MSGMITVKVSECDTKKKAREENHDCKYYCLANSSVMGKKGKFKVF